MKQTTERSKMKWERTKHTHKKKKLEFTKLRLPCIAKGGLHLTPLLGSTLDESSFMSEPMWQVETWPCTLVHHMVSSRRQTNRLPTGGISPYPHAVESAEADRSLCSSAGVPQQWWCWGPRGVKMLPPYENCISTTGHLSFGKYVVFKAGVHLRWASIKRGRL